MNSFLPGNHTSSCYSLQVEIFMALRFTKCRDINTSYMLSTKGEVRSSPVVKSQQIVVYWRPSGVSQWVQKYVTETLPGKSNLQFIAGLTLNCEAKDAPAIPLRFEIRQIGVHKPASPGPRDEVDSSIWSTFQITLDKILLAGAKGLDYPLTLDFGFPETPYLAAQTEKLSPGYLFLRGEILHPCNFGISLQFGIQCDKATSSEYYLELHKLNEDNAFEVSHPYTLVYRSEQDELLPTSLTCHSKRVEFPESKLANGDLDRVLKVDVFKKDNYERKGFALTTLGSLLKDHIQVLDVDKVDNFNPHPVKKVLGLLQKEETIKVILNLGSKVPSPSLDVYFQQGWRTVPIFAVDYSRSNWNETLHKRVLHDTSLGNTIYEEALEMSCTSISPIITSGHGIFYGFGAANDPFMNVYRTDSKFLQSTLKNYQDGLCLTLMSALTLNQERSPVDGPSSSRSSSSSTSAYSPTLIPKNALTAFLNDLVALITARTNALEYFTVMIFTDGQFMESDRYLPLLKELSLLPVSLVFIPIGLGDLRILTEIWKLSTKVDGMGIAPSRNFVHIVHFRSKGQWESALSYEKFRSSPQEIYTKELVTPIHEQAANYFKRCFLETKQPQLYH